MTTIVRGKINAKNEWTDQQVLFRAPLDQFTTNNSHYGSRFTFDRQGHLFYTLGERGVMENAQDLSKPTGKIHRVNDDGSVPKDNPFVGKAGALPTIWSYGHRNPQGLAWDPVTGKLWESEHGPQGGDEINIIEPGKNYGWGVITMGVQPGITKRSEPGMEQPIVYYTPTIAPSGMSFYTGNQYPQWKNNLFVSALAGQQLRRLEVERRQGHGAGECCSTSSAASTTSSRALTVCSTSPSSSPGQVDVGVDARDGRSPRSGEMMIEARSKSQSQVPTPNSQLPNPAAIGARWELGVGRWELELGICRLRSGSFTVLQARQSKPSSWPPAVRKTPEKAPVLSAEEELKTLVLPPGYRVELVAKEPLVIDPIAIDFDADGRMWVLEMPGFMSEPNGANSREPINNVVVLEDTERRRRDGQAHGVRRQARAAARAQGARRRACSSASRRTSG